MKKVMEEYEKDCMSDCGKDQSSGDSTGDFDVAFTTDEALALYTLLDRRCNEQESGPGSMTRADVFLRSAKARIERRLILNLQMAAALQRNRHAGPLSELIMAAVHEAPNAPAAVCRATAQRYMNRQIRKIEALKQQDADDVRKIEVSSMPDDAVLDVELCRVDGAAGRVYPRRTPPPPVIPTVHGRRSRRRDRSQA